MRIISYIFFLVLFSACSAQTYTLPECLRKCNEYLDKELPDSNKAEFQKIKSDDVIMYHFGLGMYIRNIWLHGDRNPVLIDWFVSRGFRSPDEISNIILKVYWHHVNNKQFDIDSLLTFKLKEIERLEQKIHRQELETEEAQKIVDSMTVELKVVDSGAVEIRLPDNSRTGAVVKPTNYFKLNNAMLIEQCFVSYNSIRSKYFIAQNDGTAIRKVESSQFDSIYSIAPIENSLYLAGSLAGKNRILRIAGGVSTQVPTLNLPEKSWIKLIAQSKSLYAQTENRIFKFANGQWDVVFRKKIFDTSAHPIPLQAEIFNGSVQEIIESSEEPIYDFFFLKCTDFLKDSVFHEQWDGIGASFYPSQMMSVFNDSDSIFYATFQHDDEWNILQKKNERQRVLKSDKFQSGSIDRLGDDLYVFAAQGIFSLKDTTATQIAKFITQDNQNGFDSNSDEFFVYGKCFGKGKFLVAHPLYGVILIDLQTGKATRIDDHPKKLQETSFEEMTK